MKTNPVVWFETYVQDLQRAKGFYQTVLKTELQPLNSPLPGMEFLAFPMAQEGSGCAGALVKTAGGPSGGNSTLVYFSCQDCAVEEGRVSAAAAGSRNPRCRSARTVSSRWWATRTATGSGCTRCNEHRGDSLPRTTRGRRP